MEVVVTVSKRPSTLGRDLTVEYYPRPISEDETYET